MNEHERYLFDLQGYITIPNALDPARLDALNDVLDQQIDAAVSPDSGTPVSYTHLTLPTNREV